MSQEKPTFEDVSILVAEYGLAEKLKGQYGMPIFYKKVDIAYEKLLDAIKAYGGE